MSSPFEGLKPESLWNAFYGITTIPRPSGHEERVAAHIENWATEHGFKVRKDAIGNLVVVPRGEQNAAATERQHRCKRILIAVNLGYDDDQDI